VPNRPDPGLRLIACLPLGMHVAAGHGGAQPLAAVLGSSARAARHGGGALTVVIVLAVAAVVYLVSCQLWPFGPCAACSARRGRGAGSNERRWNQCRRCKGSGQRMRIGKRLIDWARSDRKGMTDA